MTAVKIIVGLALCSGASAVPAAETAELGPLLRRFTARSPEMAAAKARFESQKYAVREAAGALLPEISAQVRASDQQSVVPFMMHHKSYATELVVNQPIFAGGAGTNTFRLRRRELNVAEIDYLIARNQIVGGFVQSVAAYLHASDLLEVLRESEKTYRNFYEITQRKRRNGAALAYELDQARADHLSYEARVRSAQQRREAAERKLRALLQVDPEFPFSLKWPKISTASPKAASVTSRPEWRKAQIEMEKAKIAKSLAVARDLPSLHLQATYGYGGEKWDDVGEEGSETHSLGFVLNVPLFSGLSGFNRWRGAEKLRESAERNFRMLDRDSRTDMENTTSRLETAAANLTSAQSAAESAKRAVVSGLENFRVGRINLFQVVQIQSAYERSELARIDAHMEAVVAEMEWASMMGMELEKYYK